MMLSRRASIFALCFVVLGGSPQLARAESPISQRSGYAIGGFDVVAYYTDKQATRGKPEFSHVWHGAPWLFSSAENRDKFAANPDAFAPQYGGHCAVSMAGGSMTNGNPQAWTVRNGKLYLNGNEDVNRRFVGDGDTFVSKANSAWRQKFGDGG
jgi:hypothetical protein